MTLKVDSGSQTKLLGDHGKTLQLPNSLAHKIQPHEPRSLSSEIWEVDIPVPTHQWSQLPMEDWLVVSTTPN